MKILVTSDHQKPSRFLHKIASFSTCPVHGMSCVLWLQAVCRVVPGELQLNSNPGSGIMGAATSASQHAGSKAVQALHQRHQQIWT